MKGVKRIVIVGGGIGGLSTAYFIRKGLEEMGLKVGYLLLEKGRRLGGNIVTEYIDGCIVEGGPDCFLSEKPWALRLCEELGLEDRLLCTNEGGETFVLHRGRLYPLPEGFILMVPTRLLPFLLSPLISPFGKLRIALDLILPRGGKGDESLGDFVRRRLGREVLEKIAEPLVAGVHAGDPERMSVRSSFPKFVEMEERHRSLILAMVRQRRRRAREGHRRTMFMTLKGGLSELVYTIVDRLDPSTILTGVEVLEIGKACGSYLLHLRGREPLRADALILATPAYVSGRLLERVDPGLSQTLKEIPYVSTATVSMAFRKEDLKAIPRGFGLVIPRREERRIMAVTWTSLKFPYRCPDDTFLLRCFVGGSRREELVFLEDRKMIEMVREELRDIAGIEAQPTMTRIFRWEKAMPQYTIGHGERLRRIEEGLSSHPGLFLTGSGYDGIGISDCIRRGREVARKVLDYVVREASL